MKTDFLDAMTCGQVCAEVCKAAALPAEIFGETEGFLNQTIRNTWEVALTTGPAVEVGRRIAELAHDIGEHFRMPLKGCEGPSFLVYRAGGFYRPHRDRASGDEDRAAVARARRVSVVVFLNAMSPDPGPGEYAGGALTFYGVVNDPGWRDYGFALDPTPGLLVAFPSDVLHEVMPVLTGERYTVVDWFHA